MFFVILVNFVLYFYAHSRPQSDTIALLGDKPRENGSLPSDNVPDLQKEKIGLSSLSESYRSIHL